MIGKYDQDVWFKTGELIERGWRRAWLEPVLGTPKKWGQAKLWPKEKALLAERHPAFAEALTEMVRIAKEARFVTAAHEMRALDTAIRRYKSGALPDVFVEAVDFDTSTLAPPDGDFITPEWRDDALTLHFEDGRRIIVPAPFLLALQRGLGEEAERVRLAADTVINDWCLGRITPTNWLHGRAYFLGAVKRNLLKLQELEGGQRTAEPAPTAHPRPAHAIDGEDTAPPRRLH